MIRGIIFDCFGVLYTSGAEALRAMCPDESKNDFDDLVKQADYGFIDGKEYVEQISLLISQPAEEITAKLREWRVRNEQLVGYVKTLRSQYNVGLLSNVSSNTIDYLITPEEQSEWFDEVVLSCDVHLTKPDPNIFVYTAERLGLRPDECVMIDDMEENCVGASHAGMQAIWYASNDQAVGELQVLLARDAA